MLLEGLGSTFADLEQVCDEISMLTDDDYDDLNSLEDIKINIEMCAGAVADHLAARADEPPSTETSSWVAKHANLSCGSQHSHDFPVDPPPGFSGGARPRNTNEFFSASGNTENEGQESRNRGRLTTLGVYDEEYMEDLKGRDEQTENSRPGDFSLRSEYVNNGFQNASFQHFSKFSSGADLRGVLPPDNPELLNENFQNYLRAPPRNKNHLPVFSGAQLPPPPAHCFDDLGTVPVAAHDSRSQDASATVSRLDRRLDRLNVVQSGQSVDRYNGYYIPPGGVAGRPSSPYVPDAPGERPVRPSPPASFFRRLCPSQLSGQRHWSTSSTFYRRRTP